MRNILEFFDQIMVIADENYPCSAQNMKFPVR